MPRNITIHQMRPSAPLPKFAYDVILTVDSEPAEATVYLSQVSGLLEPIGTKWIKPGPLLKRLDSLPPEPRRQLIREILTAIRAVKI